MNDLISQIERGELVAAEVVNGSLTKLVPDFNKTAELLRLIRKPWMPVAPETMPDNDQECIICIEGEEVRGGFRYVSGEAEGFYNKRVCYAVEVISHWMPLPAPPGKGRGDSER